MSVLNYRDFSAKLFFYFYSELNPETGWAQMVICRTGRRTGSGLGVATRCTERRIASERAADVARCHWLIPLRVSDLTAAT